MEEETTTSDSTNVTPLLWFDVVMEEETTRTEHARERYLLWFDVVMEEETTEDVRMYNEW